MKIEATKTPDGFLIPMIDEFKKIEKEKILLEVRIIREENNERAKFDPLTEGIRAEAENRTRKRSAQSQAFWNPPTLEEMLKSKADRLIHGIDQVKSDFWPEEESADDINDYIYGERRKDRLENDE